MENQKYDVCFSFADEQREYVESVYNALIDLNIYVFYDKAFEVNLWGKNLLETFSEIYLSKAKYCIMFISKEYADKAWTKYEKRNILERSFQQNSEYILPVRFDSTEVPGLFNSLMYLDATKYSPVELAEKIREKLSKSYQNQSKRDLTAVMEDMFIALSEEVKKVTNNCNNAYFEELNEFIAEFKIYNNLIYRLALRQDGCKIYLSHSKKDISNLSYSMVIRLDERNRHNCMDIINLGFLNAATIRRDVGHDVIIADIVKQLIEDLKINKIQC